jgi:ATP-dependent Lhr-like helicase
MKDVQTEAMDVDGLLALLDRIDRGEIRCVAVDTPVPSVFSHEILNANPYAYLDDAPLEERRARAVEMRRTLPEAVLSEVGRLDPAAIAQVCEDAWPEVRDADDLHDALQTLVVFPEAFAARPVETWRPWLHALERDHRAGRTEIGDRQHWVVAERARTAALVFPSAHVIDALPEVESRPAASRIDALVALLQGWLAHIGPTTSNEVAEWLALDPADVEEAMLRIESTGAVLRGTFRTEVRGRSHGHASHEWCERRLLARIHRLTLGRLRKEIAPVTAAEFMRWLLAWQHVAPGTQLPGERGTLEVLGQLQGFEAPANAWERQLLARRISNYDPEDLDRLCLTGAVGWGRLSPHPATLEVTPHTGRRVIPTSVAPVAFFVRDDAAWMAPRRRADDDASVAGLSHAARETLSLLHRSGASFFADIVRGTRRLKAEVETALWELVAAGLVTADGFDNLRALIDPKRRAGHGSAKGARPRHSAGRWSLLHSAPSGDHAATVEATCWMLLRRYGVVFRDLLARESVLPTWRELLISYRRLEDRGEVRGGRFVAGFIGEQFALPVAVESLRAARHAPPRGDTVTISAADPLNLVGILLPGERVPAVSGRFVVLRDGVPVTPEAGNVAALPGSLSLRDAS